MITTSIIMDITTGPTTTTGHGWVLKAEDFRQGSASTGTMKSAVTETGNIVGTTTTANITMAAGTDLERWQETNIAVENIAVTNIAVTNIVVAIIAVAKVGTKQKKP
jgi:hypothetical protein